MIRYVYVRSKAGEIASLVWRTAQKEKIKEETKNKKRLAQKKRCRQKSLSP